MADTDKRVGDLSLYLDGTKVAETTNVSISLNMNMVNVTSEDSNGAEENLPSYYGGSISFDFLEAPESSNYNSKDVITALTDGTKLSFAVVEKGQLGSDDFLTGSGYISDISLDSPFDGALTGSGTVTISGGVTVTDRT